MWESCSGDVNVLDHHPLDHLICTGVSHAKFNCDCMHGKSQISLRHAEGAENRSHLVPIVQELFALERKLVDYGRSNLAELEERMLSALAHFVPLQWPTQRWPIYVFMAGAMVCMLTSSVCHLFGCCRADVARWIWRFDYAGIAVLIVASFYPPVYYTFMCSPFWWRFYLSTTTILGQFPDAPM